MRPMPGHRLGGARRSSDRPAGLVALPGVPGGAHHPAVSASILTGPGALTGWEIVRQARAAHPDWTVAEHVAHLRDAVGRDIDPIWVARWLRNIAADSALSEAADHPEE